MMKNRKRKRMVEDQKSRRTKKNCYKTERERLKNRKRKRSGL
jgi:hypothetical protein